MGNLPEKHVFGFLFLFLLFYGCELDDFAEDTDDPRDNIADTWKCNEQGTLKKSGKIVYYVTIVKHPLDERMVILDNFYGLGEGIEVYAIMNGSVLTISNERVEGGFVFNGRGEISDKFDKIEWEYQVDLETGDIDNVTATFTRL